MATVSSDQHQAWVTLMFNLCDQIPLDAVRRLAMFLKAPVKFQQQSADHLFEWLEGQPNATRSGQRLHPNDVSELRSLLSTHGLQNLVTGYLDPYCKKVLAWLIEQRLSQVINLCIPAVWRFDAACCYYDFGNDSSDAFT